MIQYPLPPARPAAPNRPTLPAAPHSYLLPYLPQQSMLRTIVLLSIVTRCAAFGTFNNAAGEACIDDPVQLGRVRDRAAARRAARGGVRVRGCVHGRRGDGAECPIVQGGRRRRRMRAPRDRGRVLRDVRAPPTGEPCQQERVSRHWWRPAGLREVQVVSPAEEALQEVLLLLLVVQAPLQPWWPRLNALPSDRLRPRADSHSLIRPPCKKKCVSLHVTQIDLLARNPKILRQLLAVRFPGSAP